MNRKLTAIRESHLDSRESDLRFFTETVDAGRISPLAFFEAGVSCYKKERFYWQNADKTMTLVGIGHAAVLMSDNTFTRFTDIASGWTKLCDALIKEEKDMAPVLFGGFSFDPQSVKDSEWSQFPNANFVVPSFQLTIKNGKTLVAINLVTDSGDASVEFDRLRDERDRLIHIAQVNEFDLISKPKVVSIEEREKDQYMDAVAGVTDEIKNGDAEKVVIARSVKLNFANEVSAVTALHHISNEQQESYQFGFEKENQLFFGASPELLIEISNGRAYSACVAGSIKRGKTAIDDRKLGEELLSDSKNREEHQYVVDMISRVFNEYCTDVSIPKTPKIMKVRDIQHLFTPVEGIIEKKTNILVWSKLFIQHQRLGAFHKNFQWK